MADAPLAIAFATGLFGGASRLRLAAAQILAQRGGEALAWLELRCRPLEG